MKKEGREEDDVNSKRNEKLLKRKYYLDKIGYGFSSTQFINILFSFTGASIFFIGIINGLKSVISTFISTLIKEITQKRSINKNKISIAGLIFGFSFIILALAVMIKSPILFATTLLVSGAALTIYGELFSDFLNKYAKRGKIERLSSKSTFKGLLLAAISIILAGGIIDLTMIDGNPITITFLGETITQNIHGYLLTFEITALAFIISSYLLAKVRVQQENIIKAIDYKTHYKKLLQKAKKFLQNKYLLVMTATMIIISVFQSLMNSYTGIYVYTHMQNAWLGGFLNVAVMYAFALLISIIGPLVTAKLNKNIGVVPMFVFGTILLAILPLTIVLNPLFYPAMVAAVAISILGAAMIGSAQGILASKVLTVEDRDAFYSSSGLISMIPFMIIVTILAYIAQITSLINLFKILGYGLIILVAPLYFLIVLWASDNKSTIR